MMAVKNESLLNFVQDYQIHLIDPAKLEQRGLGKILDKSPRGNRVHQVFQRQKRLTEFLIDNPRMLMEANAARVIKAVTNTPLDIPEDAEVIDVCKAVEDMMNESKAEGRTEGAVAALAGLVKDGLLSIKDAARRANMTESAFEAEVKKLS